MAVRAGTHVEVYMKRGGYLGEKLGLTP